MAPPRLKLAKKKQNAAKLVDTDDYLQSGDSHEEAMRKHRVGDPAKALRFADRALDVYSQGLAKFPRSFDLAYNKARLELEKATDPVLSEALEMPIIDALRQALSSHNYARDLEPTHPDTLFNMAQVLTSMAERIAEDDESDDSEAIQNLEKALEIQSHCFQLQLAAFEKSRLELEQAMRETAQQEMSPIGGVEATSSNTTTEPQNVNQEEQWVSIEEPITAVTLLETIIAQIEALSALCSILSSDQTVSSMSALSWIDSYSTNLLTQTLPTLLSENQEALEPRLPDVLLPRAVFMSNYLELSFRVSAIDVEKYRQELDAAFIQPGLDGASENVLLAIANALLSLNSALADSNSEAESHAAFRWKILIDAQSRLSSVASIPHIDKHTLATTHLLRGDISLFLQILAYPPVAHSQAQTTTPQLLKHAEVYYRNASKLLGSFGSSTEEERIACELKGAVVNVLQQVTTDQAAAGSSSGQSSSGTIINMTASPHQIESALESILRVRGEEWVRDHIEDMVSDGLVLPQVFSAII
ncbi:hypothetical protein F5B22DRAFT_19496 [Xylaria bambusicola]|uniref:uncharacterized protein n=1 Tax=Xylaria bambusicola TaxID=326684 RepID=UPI0020079446|nr:uncharacterized protein F5B22DRAFT_19496 [Xylaria bambusicola]KAI0528092.1 hypothetical protein F5B22DRAFT_19496 [Xylaria bambusicola]